MEYQLQIALSRHKIINLLTVYQMKKIVFTVLFLSIITNLFSQTYPCIPKDESGKDSTLKIFTDTLKAIINRKDANALYKIIDAKILNGFGDEDGIVNFKKNWKPYQKKSDLWPLLAKITQMGGVFGDTVNYKTPIFIYPYSFECNVPENEGEVYLLYAVTGSNVNVREEPDTASKIIAMVNYELVRNAYETAAAQKIPNELNGYTYATNAANTWYGYIKTKFLYSVDDYRLFIEKRKGIWKITVLVAGD